MRAHDLVSGRSGAALGFAVIAVLCMACGSEELSSERRLERVVEPVTWQRQAELIAPDRSTDDLAPNDDNFGQAVSFSGGLALVGAPQDEDVDDGSVDDSGLAFLFHRSGNNWPPNAQKLGAAVPQAGAKLGSSVAVSAHIAVLGAPFSSVAGAAEAGLVHVVRSTDWSAAAEAISDPAPAAGNRFGWAVAANGASFIATTPWDSESAGAAYVFDSSQVPAARVADLVPTDTSPRKDDLFGAAAALDGERVLVGAPGDQERGSQAGAAYVFKKVNGAWEHEAKLLGSDSASYDQFGAAVDLKGNLAVVSAPGHAGQLGAAYVFRFDNGSWTESRLPVDENVTFEYYFGTAAAIDGNFVLIGAPGRDDGNGAIFPYSWQGGQWLAQPVMPPFAEYVFGSFGYSIATSGGSALIGVPKGESNQGLAPVIALVNGSTCSDDGDCATGHCVDSVCCDSACEGPCLSCLGTANLVAQDGTCSPLPAASPSKHDGCVVESTASCQTTGLCDGAGKCALYARGTLCRAASCQDESTEEPAEFCDGYGTCTAHASIACDPYACPKDECVDSCENDDGCGDGKYCTSEKTCTSKLGIGVTCDEARVCDSGFCVDGVCCSARCEGQCEACAEAKTPGVCVPTLGMPRGSRPACAIAPAKAPCTQTSCDGKTTTSCEADAGAKVVCQTANCSDGLEQHEGRCDGSGKCAASQPTNCGAYRCGKDACLRECASDDDCAAASYCGDGECRAGAHCSIDRLTAFDANGHSTECKGGFLCENGTCLTSCGASSDCATEYACAPQSQKCVFVREKAGAVVGCSCRSAGGASDASRAWSVPALALLATLWRRKKRAVGASPTSLNFMI